jgi:RNA polymerase-binding protein DksA
MGLAKESLERFARRALWDRKRSLMTRREAAEHDASELLDEKESDWEDRAAHVGEAQRLQRLADAERTQLARVSAALDRLDDGSWGTCVACGAAIGEARLRAVPEASRCARCTNHT